MLNITNLKDVVKDLGFFKNRTLIISLWIVVAVFSAIKQFAIGKYNNYLIFKHVYLHTIEKKSLYALYPESYFDHNHYGPFFSLFIAPFAVLPDAIGMTLWTVFNAVFLIFAIIKLPVTTQKVNLILWICFHEFLTSILGFQFNPIMTGLIILSFVYINEGKDSWAALCIVLGTFIKLYGIVGLAFFIFSNNKLKFIFLLLIWSVLFFVLPMAISSPDFIINSYNEWFLRLIDKNNENVSLNSMQDISLMGLFRRVFDVQGLSNLFFLTPGIVLFGLPYLRLKYYSNKKFRLLLLSSVLIFTVIFSSGSESPTYIIAFVGVAIWFTLQNTPVSATSWFFIIYAVVLTSFSPSDLMPRYLRETYIQPYALKALPCVLIWFRIIYEMIFINSKSSNITL